MRRGFQIHVGLINDYDCYKLSGREFKRQLLDAIEGKQNTLSRFVKPWDGRLPHNEWVALRSAVFERDNYTCQYCGERAGKLECDHIHPLAKGGSDAMENLATACFGCNRTKRDKTLAEWQSVS